MPCPQSKLALAAPVVCWVLLSVSAGQAQQPAECTAEQTRLVAGVTDRTTRAPLAGATVLARWRDGIDRQTGATTDSAGRAVFCIPRQQNITLRASYRDFQSTEPTVIAPSSATTTYAAVIDAPGSLVRGRVVDSQSGEPVARVAVRIRNTPFHALSDTAGRFVFARIPLGDYRMQVEHIAYAGNNTTLQVREDDLDALVRLTAAAIALQPIVVTAFSRRLEHVGFYERRKRGVGTFFDRKQIDAMNIQDASDLLRRLPQLKLVPQLRRGSNQQRNATVGRRGNCRFTFVIDGSRTLPDFEMDFVAAGALEGVEVYNGLAEIPASFKAHTTSVAGSTVCGVIAIWTRDSR